ncbi:MAG: hypothetical protein ACLU9X_07485 [Alistipes shahii]
MPGFGAALSFCADLPDSAEKEPGRMPSFSLQILQEKDDGIALLPGFSFYSSSS